ncbi:MAG: response regulator [Chloroflexi bacterium]|nr:response regulator [Chloroflexota bacterium]
MTSHGGVSTAIRPKVLVVDDDKSTREVIGLRLEARGYQPLLAPDPESARKYVEAHIVNLAIVDIRLQDAANQEDRSGLDFARELMRKLVPGLPVIILTAFPDPDKVNEELQHALKNDLPLQVVAKQDLSRWLEAVDWATRKSPINVGPRTNRDRLKKLIQRLESARKRGEKRLTALDMEELLRRLFLYQDTTLYLRELLPGRSGSGILLVEPNYEGVSGARLVVKSGERRSIETEATNYQRFVEPYILPSATVQIGPPVYTSDWGAMKYVSGRFGRCAGRLRQLLRAPASPARPVA